MIEEEKFYLLNLSAWEWIKTESPDETGEPFYDFSFTGRLLSSDADCPQCGGLVCVSASFEDDSAATPREWVCMACGIGGDILASFGEGKLKPRDIEDDFHIFTRSCIVVSV